NYHTGWGLYDDSLFDIARDEFTRLAAGQEPFNLTLLTIDTHSPGKPSASCLPFSEADNSILDAVYCTDQLLSGFLAFLKASPAWPNTVVALVSDHYAMRNAAQEYFPPNRDRRLLFNLLNAGDSREVQSAGTLMDIGPTVLEAIDVQHNQAFLAGQNLLNMPAELTMEQLTDTNREALIQQINSSLFTMRSKDLCEQPALLTINDGTLSVGGKNIPLSIYGSRVPVTALGSTYSLLVFWDADGSLKTTLLVPNNQLNRTLFQYREARLLVVAPNKLLPETLRRRSLATQADTLVAVMGNLRGEMVHLDLQNVDGQLQVSNSE
ncbi:MAG: sulfatase-like hydrolase/transferase, partial [Candidatus Azotimanducaceae bacterium WSBS_2022_MAG_OTU7]